MSDSNIYLDGTGNFNALTKNAGTIKYGTFNNAASNTGVVAVSAIFTGTAVNSGVIGNVLPINTASLVASNSAAWESTYNTVGSLSADWGGGGGGAADLTAISDVSASWDAAATFVSLNSSILVDTYDSRLSDERTPAAHTQAISTIDGLQTALDTKQASGSYASASHTHTTSDVTGLQAALDAKQASGSYASASHTHTTSDVTGLQAALDAKQASGSYASASHVHVISGVTGLQAALDAKQASGSYASASHTHTTSDVTGFADDVAALIDTAAGDTIASLVNGKVPSIQLPSYVDDVIEEATTGDFPATGETGKIYVAINTNKTYRWSGSAYVEISSSPGSTDAVVEGSTNLYFTNARATGALQTTINSLSTAINGKQASGSYASATHTHAISSVTGLQTALDAKQASGLYAATDDARITLVASNSASWNSTYTVVNASSATWSSSSFSTLTASAVTLTNATLSTFSTPVTASGDFVVITVGTKKRLIRLWDNV